MTVPLTARLRAGRFGRAALLTADAAFALAWLAGYVAMGTAGTAADGSAIRPQPLWLAVALAALVAAPIAVRRVWPLPALVVTLAGCCVGTLLDVTREPYVSCALVLYLVALRIPLRRTVFVAMLTLLAATAAVTVGEFIGPPANGPGGAPQVVLFLAAVLGAGTAVGALVRQRRAHAARESAEHTRRALADERLRIARELHDVVAHSLSLIAVKAAVAEHVGADRPQETFDALRTISATSRTALTEMRRVLGVLRADGELPDVAPAPDLTDLAHLVEYAGQAGVRLELDVCGAAEVPAAAAASAYRIVRESVTNVVRHAAPCTCRVRVRGSPAEVRVEVADDGPGPSGTSDVSGGHGLVGMRERVSVFGGQFSAGAGPSGGFLVRARLPCGADDA